jgi:uncharacterized membrane protein
MTLFVHEPPFKRLAQAYAVIALVFLAMDAVWLSSTAAPLYQPAVGHLMAASVDWLAAAIFYAFYFACLVFFAVRPALRTRRAGVALGHGVLLGLMAYATYDFTNQATLRDWPWHLTLIDLVWGGTVSGVSSFAAAAVALATSRRASRTRGR